MSTFRSNNRYRLEALEPRLLLSADGVAGAVSAHRAIDDERLGAAPAIEISVAVPASQVDPSATVEASPGAGDRGSLFDVETVSLMGGGDAVAADGTVGNNDAAHGPVADTAGVDQSRTTQALEGTSDASRQGEVGMILDGGEDVAAGPNGAVPSGVAQVEGSVWPGLLTETLRAANGPPTGDGVTVLPGGGRLFNVNPDNVQWFGNELVVDEGDILMGTGGEGLAVFNNGVFRPGHSPAITTVGTFNQGAAGELEIEIGGTVVGTQYDQLQVTGAATLNGRLRISLISGFVPTLGQTFTVVTWGSRPGATEFENYLNTADIGGGLSFVPVYTPGAGAGSLVLQVVATPNYNPVKTQVEGVVDTLGQVGNVLDGVGSFATALPFIGGTVGNLVDTGKSIRDVLVDKLNDLSGASTTLADVTAWLEGFDGQTVLGHTMHVEGVLGHSGATTANPFWWDVDLYFTHSEPITYSPGASLPFSGTLTGAVTGAVTSRFDLDFSFGRDATGYFVELHETRAAVDLNTSPSFGVTFAAPVSAAMSVVSGTAVLHADLVVQPNAGIQVGGRIYLATLQQLRDGALSLITNFTYTPTATIAVDLQLNASTASLGGGLSLSGGANARLQMSGSNLFTAAPDVDFSFQNATLNLGAALPNLQGTFKINTDGSQTYIDATIAQLDLSVGATRILRMNGNASFVLGDGTLAGKADLNLVNGPALPNLTLTGGTWQLEVNTGNAAATVPYLAGTASIPGGPYLRVEGDGTGLGFTINPTFTLTGSYVFEKSGANVVVGATGVAVAFADDATDLITVSNGSGAFLITAGGLAGRLTGTLAETIPGVDLAGTFTVAINTTGAVVNQSVTVDGTTLVINIPNGTYLRVEGIGATVSLLGVTLTGDFVFENRNTSTGAERVITVAMANGATSFGDGGSPLVSLTNASGAFFITNAGMAGTGTATYALSVPGVAVAAAGTATLAINQTAVAVNETVQVGAVPVALSVPAGPYLRLDTVGTTLTILGSTVTGNFAYEQSTADDGSEVVKVAASNAGVSLKQAGISLLTLTNAAGLFIFNEDGMSGSASGTLAESILDITTLASVSGSFALTINTTGDEVDEEFTTGMGSVSVMAPAGPYLKITGDDVTLSFALGAVGTATITGDFGFEQQKDAGGNPVYVKVGATDVDADLTAVGITVQARDGAGGFILTSGGIAGEVTLGSLGLVGAGSFLTVTATDVRLRLNSTNADVAETTVATSSTDSVTFSFVGSYYRNYIGVSGAVTVNLLNFADFSGDVAFELFNPGAGNLIRLAAHDVSMEFKLGPSMPSLISFNHGSGGFVITSAGLAGTATLDFQTGFVTVNGTIKLEVNTTLAAQSASWTAPDGSAYSFNLTTPNYLSVCVNGHVVVASIDLPLNFEILESGGNLVFRTKGGAPQVIFTISPSGTWSAGPYWTSLGIVGDIDFANPSPEDILMFIQRLANWFNLLKGSSLFDVEIPFTDGKTLEDAFDWSTGFIDLLYSKLVSTEIAAYPTVLPAAGAYAGSFIITLTPAGGAAITKTVSFSGNWTTGLGGLVTAINTGLAAPAVLLSGRVAARINRDGGISIALTEAEIKANTLQFSIATGTGAFLTAGFSASQGSQTISRYTLDQFPYALSRIIGIAGAAAPTPAQWPFAMTPPAAPGTIISNTPITYDPARKLYVFPVTLTYAPTPYNVAFDFGTELGPLGDASLTGNIRFAPSLNFNFNLGLDLNAKEVPRVIGSQFIPAPSNGRISQDLTFKLYLNGSASPITVSLPKAAANANTTLQQLVSQLNGALGAAADYISPGGSTIDLRQLVVFQQAGPVLALSVIQEDLDGDGHRDLVFEDINGNHVIDAGEDIDGDGYLDVVETDLNADGDFDNQLGLINQIRLTVDKDSVFATELGFGDEIRDPDAGLGYPNGYYETTVNSSMKGFFLENVDLNASLTITTPVAITGSLVFGFLRVDVAGGVVKTEDPYTHVAKPLRVGVDIRDPTTGNQRFYLDQLMDVLTNIGTYIDGPNLTGAVYAGFSGITAKIGGQTVISSGEISVWIPEITALTLNENAYDITDVRTDNDTGIFLTYPNVGLAGGFSFEHIGFTDIIQGLQAVVDTLDDFSAFSFLNEKIPFIDVSLHDLVDYAGQFADLIEAVGGSDSSTNIQDLLVEMEDSIETLFHLDPSTFSISLDTNGIDYTNGVLSDVITHDGSGAVKAFVTFNPNGNNNAFTVTAAAFGAARNGVTLRIQGDSGVTGNTATASWDPAAKVITLLIDPANTTTQTIVNAINSQIGAAWTAVTVADGAGPLGSGKLRTNALKFHWKFTAAYANQLPFQFDIAKLLSQLGGDNPAVSAFLQAATSLIHVEGSGLLNVSASAEATLDFGLDLTNPSTITPFLYDTTGVDLKAKVTATNLEFEASLGALGIFIRHGEVTFDYDGKGGRTDSAVIHLGLKDADGDARHYFDSSLLSFDTIDFSAHGGVTAILPLYAPTAAIPIGSTSDTNGDGYADNALVADIPDLVRLLIGDTTSKNAAGQEQAILIFRGDNNDLKLTVTGAQTGVKVKFVNNPALPPASPTASYNAGARELTFTVRSGQTTAQQLITATAGTLAANGFTLALNTADPAGNTGVGKLAKITLAAPDLNSLFDNLDLCTIIDSATGPFLDALDGTLADIQHALEDVVLNTDLPLLGDGLQGAANFIEDFRNGLLAELRSRIAAADGSAIGAIEDAIKEAIWTVLGPPGLNLLVDPTTSAPLDPAQGYDQLDVTLSCDNGLYVNIRLAKTLALLDTTQNPIDFDIGVPGFGLKVDGNVVVSIGFDLKLRFGFNSSDGFYLGTGGGMEDPELKLNFSATIPGLHAAGELFFLQLDVNDSATSPSSFTGGFYVDLRDPNGDGKLTWAEMTSSGTDFEDIIHGELQAVADVNLALAASFGGNTNFPRILADFHLGWEWSLGSGLDPPTIEFNNVSLDLGSYISDVLGPILSKIQEITEPLQPVIDIATAPLPILSQLAGKDITFLDLAEAFGYLDPGTRKFIEQVLKVIEIINDIPTGEGSILIPIGSFSLGSSGNSGNYDSVNPLGNLSSVDLEGALNAVGTGSTASSTQISQTSGFVGANGIGSLDNFKFPFLQNPSELFGLFTGQAVRLVEWQMPTFKFEFTYVQKIPIYPPLYAQFGGTIGATFNIGFGYDTAGIQQFIANGAKNVLDIFDGFYIADFDADGNERPEVVLTGKLFAGVSLNLGIVEVGVNGGVEATIEFDLNDVVDDGRVRVSELIANAAQDPRCIFDIHGEVTLFLEAFLKVNLLFFSIDKTWRFGEFVLFTFDITCPEPVLADVSGGVLYLHVGTRAGQREEINTTDGDETFIVTTVSGGAGSETVQVAWGHYKQEFSGFTSIVADLGEGRDLLDLRGVLTKALVTGGNGDDTIYLGLGASSTANGDAGNDLITLENDDLKRNTGVVIRGGDGTDTLTGAQTAITIYGDGGTDTLTGSPENDVLDGGEGADTITGGKGDDTITGGSGNDIIDAGIGNDTVDAGAGNDIVEAGEGSDRVNGGSGNDLVYGSVGNDIIAGGPGDDKLFGHGGSDLVVGDDFDWMAVAFDLSTASTAAGSFPVLNLTGTGNDMVIGGGGYDLLFGGDGDDFVFGGNYFDGGTTEVIEEDDNDFLDGGRGSDSLFGDDSFGKEGERITGISIESVVFHDVNLNGIHDDGDRGLAGVKVYLYKASDNSLFTSTQSDSAGRFKLSGLDPLDYYLQFIAPDGYSPTIKDAVNALGLDDPAEPDTDSDVSAAGKTGVFQMDFDEEDLTISAGFQGAPGLSVTTAAVKEGGSGQKTAVNFVLALSGPSGNSITINYHTADGFAQAADGDYDAIAAGSVVFAPGETSKSVTVFVNGDATYERHEDFTLVVQPQNLSQLKVGTPATTNVLTTIVNDDGAPQLSITDVTVSEPASGIAEIQFKVRLTNNHWQGVQVRYQTSDAVTLDEEPAENSATAVLDYVPVPSTPLSFGPGELEKIVKITVKGDSLDEYDETFFVNLFNPVNAELGDDRGYAIIKDTDAAVTVSITPSLPDEPLVTDPNHQRTSLIEGNSVTQAVTFDVTLSGVTGKSVTVRWDASRGTAISSSPNPVLDPEDFLNLVPADATDAEADAATTVTFIAGGPLTQKVTVWVNGDTVDEGDEFFYVNLLSADGADVRQNHGIVRIIDDDTGAGPAGSPYDIRFSRSDFQVDETDGVTTGYVTLVRSSGPTQAYTVLTITGGTARNVPLVNADYSSAAKFLVSFAVGETVKQVPIMILGDVRNEANETITFGLRTPTGAPVVGQPGNATLTIIDDDDVLISVVPFVTGQAEGAPATTTGHSFFVYLADADTLALTTTEQTINFTYATQNLTAQAGSDYTATAGAGTFDSVNNFFFLNVDVKGDAAPEFTETFRFQLSTASGIGFYHSFADGVIKDDDAVPVTGLVFKDTNNNGYRDSGEAAFAGVTVKVTDSAGTASSAVTNASGIYTANVVLGDLSMKIDETATGALLDGWELTTENDSQQAGFAGGLSPLTDVGYRFTFNFSLPKAADSSSRGGTDDTIFGGPGDDVIDGGAGDDHIIGGHWQTATDNNAPINKGTYSATVKSNVIGAIVNPQTAPIWTVDTTGLGPRSISGQIWVDTNNSDVQDEGLYLSEVVVTVLDGDGNVIKTVATANGQYSFTGLYAGKYIIEFDLPDGQQFVAPSVGGPTVNSDVLAGGRTTKLDLTAASMTNIDAGLEPSGTLPTASGSGIEFSQASYHVSENDHVLASDPTTSRVTITLVRGNASTIENVVWYTTPGTAVSPTNFIEAQGVATFGVGETLVTFDITIKDTDTLGICDTLSFTIDGRRPTGQPLVGGQTTVYIHGDGAGANTDDDDIAGGGDWDVILGDSGTIDADAIPATSAIVAGIFTTATTAKVHDEGGLGHDVINGGDGPDYINAQLGNDVVAGNEGTDAVTAGYGDDLIIAELDDDAIDGAHGDDTLQGEWDGQLIYLKQGLLQFSNDLVLDAADSEFTFVGIETADLRGGPGANVFRIDNWNSEAFIFGDDGADRLEVSNDLPSMTLKNPTLAQQLLYLLSGRPLLQGNLTLSTGPVYHFGEMEHVVLSGGSSDNLIDAGGYSRAVSLEGLGGNDTLIGGSGANTFLFRGLNLGADTLTGGAGVDVLDFSTQAAGVTVNLSTVGAAYAVNTTTTIVTLLLTAEDIEGVTGGLGGDTLTGNSLDNILIGGPGADILTGLAGSEVYGYDTDSPWGSDTINESSADPGYDVIDFSATTSQSIVLNLGLSGSQVVNGNLTLTIGGDGIDEVIGGSLGDTLTGNAGPNTLRGGPGDDVLFGAAGDDFLDGGTGVDVLDGGFGTDSIAVTANSNITLTNAQVLRNGADVDYLNAIEAATLTGGSANNTFTLTGWSGAALIDGAGGNDRLVYQVDGSMTLTGAAGSDALLVTTVSGTWAFTLTNVETYLLTGGVGDNALDAGGYTSGGAVTLNGGPGNDTLIGSPGDDGLLGGTGNDIITGNAGFDAINGGDGIDTVLETRSGTVFLTVTGLLWGGGSETDEHTSVEAVNLNGGAGGDGFGILGLTSSVTAISFSGGAGSDILAVRWNGTVTLTDALLVLSGNPVVITLNGIEQAIVVGGAGNDGLNAAGFTGASTLSGGDGDDTLTGGSGVDSLVGGNGNDLLTGNGGNDTLNGGDGDDTYRFDTDTALGSDAIVDSDGSDTLDFTDSSNAVVVNLGLAGQVVNGNLSLSWAAAVQLENLIGGSAADTLTGNAADNRITGNAGADTINGGAGTDTVVEVRDATMTLANAALTIGVEGVDGLVSIEAARLTGGAGGNTLNASLFTGSVILDGQGGADTLTGGSGADTLIGGAGNDGLIGGGGDDTYLFDADTALGADTITDASGTDTLDFAGTALGIAINLASAAIQVVNANLSLTLTVLNQIENVTGGSGNDSISGNALVNRLSGGLGSDTLTGTGNDILIEERNAHMTLTNTSLIIGAEANVIAGFTRAELTGGAGNNTLNASAFTNLAILRGGAGHDILTGGSGGSQLFGEAGNDTLTGGSGTDVLDGGDGSDTLTAGGGANSFTGGNGDDTYIFDLSVASSNTVTEFFGGGLHDALLGAGGALINLSSSAVQTPDAVNHPAFTIQLPSLNLESSL